MGACASKPKGGKAVKADVPAPEPVDDMVKNTEEVKVVEDEKRVDVNNEKNKEYTEQVVVEEAKPRSLDSLLVEKEAAPTVEVPSVTKAEEQPPKEAAAVAVEEVKKSEEKATEKDEKSA